MPRPPSPVHSRKKQTLSGCGTVKAVLAVYTEKTPFIPSATWLSLDVLKPNRAVWVGGLVITIDVLANRGAAGTCTYADLETLMALLSIHTFNQQGPKQHGKSSFEVFKGRKKEGDGYPYVKARLTHRAPNRQPATDALQEG